MGGWKTVPGVRQNAVERLWEWGLPARVGKADRGRSSTIETMSIALPAELARFVASQVESGLYASRSEVVRAALRAWGEWDAWVHGVDGGPGADPSAEARTASSRPARSGPPAEFSGRGLPPPLIEQREELLKIAAEEGVGDLRVLSTRPPAAAVEAGATLTWVHLVATLAPDRTIGNLVSAGGRMGKLLGCTVFIDRKLSVSMQPDARRVIRNAPPL